MSLWGDAFNKKKKMYDFFNFFLKMDHENLIQIN